MTSNEILKQHIANGSSMFAEVQTLDELVLRAMKEYAERKCREQRELCVIAYTESDWVEVDECKESILEADEPIFD